MAAIEDSLFEGLVLVDAMTSEMRALSMGGGRAARGVFAVTRHSMM